MDCTVRSLSRKSQVASHNIMVGTTSNENRFPKDAWWDATRARPGGKWIHSGRLQLNKIISTRDISRLNIYQKYRLRFTGKIGEHWDENLTLVGTYFISQGRLIKVRT
jgi:hypothetical protein